MLVTTSGVRFFHKGRDYKSRQRRAAIDDYVAFLVDQRIRIEDALTASVRRVRDSYLSTQLAGDLNDYDFEARR